MSKSLILTAGIGYSYRDLERFMKSYFKQCADSCDLIVITDCNIEKRATFKDHGVEIFPYSSAQVIPTVINNSRYFAYMDVLLCVEGQYENVFLCDSRDLIFQGNIFDAIHDEGLHFFLEDKTIQQEYWNSMWIERFYGVKALREIQSKPIVCSGTTYGSFRSIVRYVSLMVNEMPRQKFVNFGQFAYSAYDQGIHNYLIHNNMIDLEVHMHNNHKIVSTLGFTDKKHIKLLENGMFEVQETVPVVLHQYDRHMEIFGDHI
jgi:hypothetical protein